MPADHAQALERLRSLGISYKKKSDLAKARAFTSLAMAAGQLNAYKNEYEQDIAFAEIQILYIIFIRYD